jgi:hypothetical protein
VELILRSDLGSLRQRIATFLTVFDRGFDEFLLIPNGLMLKIYLTGHEKI